MFKIAQGLERCPSQPQFNYYNRNLVWTFSGLSIQIDSSILIKFFVFFIFKLVNIYVLIL